MPKEEFFPDPPPGFKRTRGSDGTDILERIPSEPHPVDERWTMKVAPHGMREWFTEFKNTRAYSRIEKELAVFRVDDTTFMERANHNKDCPHPSLCNDLEYSRSIRIPVYESCYQAISWSEENAPALIEDWQRTEFLRNLKKTVKHFRLAKKEMKKAPKTMNHLSGNMLMKLYHDRGRALESLDKDNRVLAHELIFDVLDCVQEVLEETLNPEKPEQDIKKIAPYAFPFIAFLSRPYMCFTVGGKTTLARSKRPDKVIALTIHLSTIFRFSHTKGESVRITELKQLKAVGKPYWSIAAIVALSAIEGPPSVKSPRIHQCEQAAGKYIRENPTLFVTPSWDG